MFFMIFIKEMIKRYSLESIEFRDGINHLSLDGLIP